MPDVSFPTTESSQSTSKSGLGGSSTGSKYQDTRSLAESFSLLTRYGDEFMDENPLVGEPGSFILSRTGGETTGLAVKGAPKTAANATGTPSTLPVRASTPQVRVETPGKASEKSNSPPSSTSDKGKRKKARIVS